MGTEKEYPAVRWQVRGRFLGQLALVLALLALPNVGGSLYDGEYPISVRYL